MKQKIRLDELLVLRKLAPSIREACALIMSGRVISNSSALTKSGTQVTPDHSIEIKEKNPYVSRGGLKLRSAIEYFHIKLKDSICMDIGASTGGFTDCLLQSGAKKVYAVDVGKNLLDSKLKSDPRVECLENINFRYFSREILKEPVEFVTIDVSFISLEKIIPIAISHLSAEGMILALVKPQFELPPSKTIKGVVRDENSRLDAISKIRDFAAELGLSIIGKVDCPVKGPKGNREHFLLLKKP